MPATGALIGTPASMSASDAAADRRHRGRAVRLEDLGDDADRVRETLSARACTADERALGERAVTDLAAAGAAHAARSRRVENGGKL